MFRTQVYLTSNEREKLIILSRQLGLHQSAIIREALDQYIERKLIEKRRKSDVLKRAAGMWADRDDLPDLRQLRKELERGY